MIGKFNLEVTVFQTRKANGENCQISALNLQGEWNYIISSKNVSILARSKEDINKYKESADPLQDRFYFARLIAEAWFQWLDHFPHQDLNKLNRFLEDHSLVGEYVGNPNLQHLVRYDSVYLLFYAVVDKHSNDNCLSIEQSYKLLDSFGLKRVNYNKVGPFKRFDQLL